MSALLSPAESRGRWYGYYTGRIDPAWHPPRPVVDRFVRLAGIPPTSPQAAGEFLKYAGWALPSFHPVREAMRRGRLSIRLWDGDFPAYLEDGCGNGTLMMSGQYAPGSRIAEFVTTVAPLCPLPAGVRVPSQQPSGPPDQIRAILWKGQIDRVALGLSLAYQVVLEMDALGIKAYRGGRESLLGAADLALFKIFREGGLDGLAEAYPRFMQNNARYLLEQHIDDQVKQILAGGAAAMAITDVEGERGLRPDWQRTVIDDLTDRSTRFARGLYTQAEGLGTLDPVARAEIEYALQQRIEGSDDAAQLLETIHQMAPQLAATVLAPLGRGEATVEVVAHGGPQPVIMRLDRRQLMGDKGEKLSAVFIQPGTTGDEAARMIVSYLATAALPPEMFKDLSVLSSKEHGLLQAEVVRLLKEIRVRREMWGYSAMFELVHEATARGVSLPLGDKEQEMRRVLDECGYEVLCERYSQFSDPVFDALMRRQDAELAAEIVRSS